MSTKSREVIFGSSIRGAKIRADAAPAAGHANLEAGGGAEMPIVQDTALLATGAHDQANGNARDHAYVWVHPDEER